MSSDEELVYLPLGGAGEIGMNMYLYGIGSAEDGHDWLMVDCGITFADNAITGVDVITPDPAFIAERRDRLKGLVITHAHEDHVGAVPYLWKHLRCPVYASPFAADFLRRKLSDEGVKDRIPIQEIPLGGTAEIGPFSIETVPMAHSIPEASSVAIRTRLGTVLHTGDFKFDPGPVVGKVSDEEALKRIGDEGVLAMVCDSTNVFSDGQAGSEASLLDSLTETIAECPNRVVVTCFASNVARLQTIAKAAAANDRSVVLVGRSLYRIVDVARGCGYLQDIPTFVDEKDAEFLPRENTLIVSTGCQGEPRAALTRMANESHPRMRLDKGDTVIFSARIIPGNEVGIARLHNELIRRGIDVITERDRRIHVSGHPARGEVARMYELVRPQIAIPMHGETIHLKEQRRLARDELGVEQVVLAENGSMVRLNGEAAEIVDAVPVGRFAVDGNRLLPMDGELVRERIRTVWNGAVTVTVVVDAKGGLVAEPQLTSTGTVAPGEEELEQGALKAAAEAIRSAPREARDDDEDLAEAVRLAVRRYFRREIDKKPVISVHLVRV